MAIVVQKFGGTSLADVEKIKNVARAVVREKELGNDVVVVVSAMGHTTDNLIKLAHEISKTPQQEKWICLCQQANKFLFRFLQ